MKVILYFSTPISNKIREITLLFYIVYAIKIAVFSEVIVE